MTGILIIIFFVLLIIHLGFWIFYYKQLAGFNFIISNKIHEFPGVSVIICYKNESPHIVETVNAVLSQTYPKYEVIAMNDFSSDNGQELLSEINNPKLKSLSTDIDNAGKKQALKEAISHAKYNLILLTDADCIPSSKHWIDCMVNIQISENAEIVLGYSPMKTNYNLITKFSAFETAMTALQYLTFALGKMAYMGVGRNLMYKKEIFEKFADESYYGVIAGDDDLLIQKAASSSVIAACFDRSAWVYTIPKTTVSTYLHQKSRHVGVAGAYNLKMKFILIWYALSMMGTYFTAFLIMIAGWDKWFIIPLIFIVKWIIQYFCHYRFFDYTSSEIKRFYPLYEIWYVIYLWIISAVTLFDKGRNWT